ncbi:MAG: hypothetical protein JWQ71_4697 [Pedosphaera sp.]|nr:hypothetical protein [Pedosphaera sp.]
MPEAHITSLDALKAFRANLLIYMTKARPTLEEVNADVVRTRNWVENDQRTLWEGQMKRRTRALEEAQAALFSANMSNLRDATVAEQTAVVKAKQARNAAEDKLRVIKLWNRNFDNRTEPLVKQMERLHSVLANDLPKAVAFLTQTINTLEAYAGIVAPSASGESAPANSPSAEPNQPAPSSEKNL